MLQVPVAFSLLLACSTLQPAAPTRDLLKAELKEVPSDGKSRPLILVEGTAGLPNGVVLNVYLHYGRSDSKAIFMDFATVSGGKFVQDCTVFKRRNLPGKYIARIHFNPALQGQAIPGAVLTNLEVSLQVGTADDFEREAKAVRAQLAGEIQTLVGLGEEVKAKIQELKDKPAGAWAESLREWTRKTVEIQGRSLPTGVPEYSILGLDLIADSGMENLAGILNSAARYAAAGKSADALEGLTRLRQTAEYWIGEINSPKITDPREIVRVIESARTLIQETLSKPDVPALPARRRFVEMNALLQKSLSEDFQPVVLEIGTRSAAFFNAVSDKDAQMKEFHAELDKLLDKLAAPFRPLK
jgi:hypothetical protein